MAENTNTSAEAEEQPPQPNPALKCLDVLVGTWGVAGHESGTGGEVRGQVTFEWLEGGFYLLQHVDIDHSGRRIKGTEYIGYDKESNALKSYVFSNIGPGPFGSFALEYVWEVGDDTLTIWGGFVGSPAAFRGRFSDDRRTVAGAWEWPGGGYEATMARVE